MAGGDDSEDPTPDFFSEGAAADAGPDLSPVGRVRPGTLLLAGTDLIEPTFARTVIYMIEHNDAGSLGLVLNRMSQTAIHDLLPRWTELAASPRAFFVGGPVKQDSAMCLGVVKRGVDTTGIGALHPVDGRVMLVDLDADPADLADVLEGIRVFAGYAGWGIGQLDGELEQNNWMLASALPRDVLARPTVDIWADVLRRQPWPAALLATHPIDVGRN